MHVLVLAGLGLRCCAGFSLVSESRGCSLVAVLRLLIAVASLAAQHGLWGAWASVVGVRRLQSTGSIVVAHGLSFPKPVGSSLIRDQTCVSCTGRQSLYH